MERTRGQRRGQQHASENERTVAFVKVSVRLPGAKQACEPAPCLPVYVHYGDTHLPPPFVNPCMICMFCRTPTRDKCDRDIESSRFGTAVLYPPLRHAAAIQTCSHVTDESANNLTYTTIPKILTSVRSGHDSSVGVPHSEYIKFSCSFSCVPGRIGLSYRSSARIHPTDHMSTAGPYCVSKGLKPRNEIFRTGVSEWQRTLLDAI